MSNNITYNDFKNICRICLKECDVPFTDDPIVSSIYFKLTNIQFEENEELPRKVCPKCSKQIRDINYFRSVCLEAHYELIKILAKNKVKKEEPIDTYEADDVASIPEYKPDIPEEPNEMQTYHHQNQTETTYATNDYNYNLQCAFCAEWFNNQHEFNCHLWQHNVDYGQLVGQNIYRNDVPFTCKYCRRQFRDQSQLYIHFSGNFCRYSFICLCQERFDNPDDFKRHKESHYKSEFRAIYNTYQNSKYQPY